MGVATLASGPLFDRFGAYGYLLMARPMCGPGADAVRSRPATAEAQARRPA